MFHVVEKLRIRGGLAGSDESFGNNGAFIVQASLYFMLCVIASDGEGWEHVSVHCVERGKERVPTWKEMCLIKDLFWDEEDCVLQYHPPRSQYVNFHSCTLHLWRPVGVKIPIPDSILVGPKTEKAVM